MTIPHGGAKEIWADSVNAEKPQIRDWGQFFETAIFSVFGSSDFKEDEPSGRASVADGEQFSVVEGLEVVRYRRDDAASSTPLFRYFSSEGVKINTAITVRDVNAPLEAALVDVLTTDELTTSVASPVGRVHSPVPEAQVIAYPHASGVSPDTPVVLNSLTINGKNILSDGQSAWEKGGIDGSGNEITSGSQIRTSQLVPISPETEYVSSANGVYGAPLVALYEADGVTYTRTIAAGATWLTTNSEVFMRPYRTGVSGASPGKAYDAQFQIEQGVVATSFERHTTRTVEYVAANLHSFEGVSDSVEGNYFVRKLETRKFHGTAGAVDIYIATGSVGSLTDYYVAYVQNDSALADGVADFLGGTSDDGGYAVNASGSTEARGIYYGTGTDIRIMVEKTKIDAEAGATNVAKFQAYLDAHPISAIFDLGSEKVTTAISSDLTLIPEHGSVITDFSGATTINLQFREVAVAGGGGGGTVLTDRVTSLEAADVSQDSLLSGLQSQIDGLATGGDTNAEVIAARTSSLGYADAVLKSRLDRMEKAAGRVNVWDFFPTWDAAANHTVPLMEASALSESLGLTLVFSDPGEERVLNVSRGIRRTTSMPVVWETERVWVKKISAVTSDVDGALSINDTVISVDDAAGFTVGYDVYVGDPESGSSYGGTRGVITAVDTGADTITIESYNNPAGSGIKTAYEDGAAVASTTFPIFYTDSVFSGATNVIPQTFIKPLLDGNRATGEADSYPCSLLHFDKVHTERNFVFGGHFKNSPADAISDQGNGGSLIAWPKMRDNKKHGAHIGYTSHGNVILYPDAEGQEDCVYFCYGNTATLVIGARGKGLQYGVREIGGQLDGDAIIMGCNFEACGIDYEVSSMSEGALIISDCVSQGNTGHVIFGDAANRVKADIVAYGATGIGCELLRSSKSQITLTMPDFTGTYGFVIGGATDSTDITIGGEVFGATVSSARVGNSARALVKLDRSVPASGAADIIIDVDAVDTHIAFGVRTGTGVTDNGANTTDAMS